VSPFSIFLMRSFFATLPDDLIEAARLDGAGELTIFLRHVGFGGDELDGTSVEDAMERLTHHGATTVTDSPCQVLLDRDGFPLRIGD
jgi:Binding-protein-dependent transport system inner membrane component